MHIQNGNKFNNIYKLQKCERCGTTATATFDATVKVWREIK